MSPADMSPAEMSPADVSPADVSPADVTRARKLPMAGAQVPLETLMKWVQAMVVHPHCVETAVDDAAVRSILDVDEARIGEVVLPSKTLTPIQRVGVYANMYPLRMRDALATDFPVVKRIVGEDAWNGLVDGYVVDHYSRHPNLNQLGRHLPAYVRTRKDLNQAAFVAEMAELEQAIVEVFDSPESPQASVAELAGLPPEQWATAKFHPVAAFRLCAFSYPVNAYLQAVKEDREPPRIKKAQTYTAVYRKSYSVWRMGLTRPQYRILKLFGEGHTVIEALFRATKGGGSDVAGSAQQLRAWFQEWFQEGWFGRIEIPEAE